MNLPQSQQRFDTLATRFTDTDENTRGERHRRPARQLQCLQAYLWVFIRGTIMRHAFLTQARRGGFEHDSHGRTDCAQRRDLVCIHTARVNMWQQPGFLQHPGSHFTHILQCAGKTHFRKRAPRRCITQFWLFTQGEKCFLAAHLSALATQFQYLLNTHIGLWDMPGCLGEGAVVADIATQMGQRNEHLARIADKVPVREIAPLPCHICQQRGIRYLSQQQSLLRVGKVPPSQMRQHILQLTHDCFAPFAHARLAQLSYATPARHGRPDRCAITAFGYVARRDPTVA